MKNSWLTRFIFHGARIVNFSDSSSMSNQLLLPQSCWEDYYFQVDGRATLGDIDKHMPARLTPRHYIWRHQSLTRFTSYFIKHFTYVARASFCIGNCQEAYHWKMTFERYSLWPTSAVSYHVYDVVGRLFLHNAELHSAIWWFGDDTRPPFNATDSLVNETHVSHCYQHTHCILARSLCTQNITTPT